MRKIMYTILLRRDTGLFILRHFVPKYFSYKYKGYLIQKDKTLLVRFNGHFIINKHTSVRLFIWS